MLNVRVFGPVVSTVNSGWLSFERMTVVISDRSAPNEMSVAMTERTAKSAFLIPAP